MTSIEAKLFNNPVTPSPLSLFFPTYIRHYHEKGGGTQQKGLNLCFPKIGADKEIVADQK